jgi:glycosyltransferase involved in cell wall biosynthesis
VAICTWNRAALLDQTLAELGKLHIPAGFEWEVIVVNNNCTDDTDGVLARYMCKLPLVRLFESRQGKSYAANLAVEHSRGDLIVWTDDDVLVDPDWLVAYVKAAEQWPQATFFGGTIDPWFAEEPPRWIRQNFGQLCIAYAARQLGPEVRPLVGDELPYGANMALRRQAFAARGFDTTLGPCGNEEVRGEETDLLTRLRERGHQGIWVGTARVRHYIPAARLRRQYLWDYFLGGGRVLVRQKSCEACKWLWGAPRWAIWMYWHARLRSWLLASFKGKRWVRAFREAALCRGVIEESRAASTLPASPDLLRSTKAVVDPAMKNEKASEDL